jgi:hypothetical protein
MEAGSNSGLAMESAAAEGGVPSSGFLTASSSSSSRTPAGVAAAEGGGTGGSIAPGELSVEELWRAGKELRGVLEALGVSTDSLFTEKEVRSLLQNLSSQLTVFTSTFNVYRIQHRNDFSVLYGYIC